MDFIRPKPETEEEVLTKKRKRRFLLKEERHLMLTTWTVQNYKKKHKNCGNGKFFENKLYCIAFEITKRIFLHTYAYKQVVDKIQDGLTRFCSNLTKIVNLKIPWRFGVSSSDATNFDHFRWSWTV